MFGFDFQEKSLGIVSPTHFVYDFSSVCFSVCVVINFEINLVFLIKPFFYMTKTARQKFKYLEYEKTF